MPPSKRVDTLGLADVIEFAGGVDFEDVLGFYERNGILVLASETEGCGAIAEGNGIRADLYRLESWACSRDAW